MGRRTCFLDAEQSQRVDQHAMHRLDMAVRYSGTHLTLPSLSLSVLDLPL